MTALACWLTSAGFASAEPAPACPAARAVPTAGPWPEAWRVAVDALIRSTAEPGHPWSCAGGSIDLELAPTGARLGVGLAGEDMVWRRVTSPEDVLPLGQALLATPLPPPPDEHETVSADPAPSALSAEAKPPAESPVPAVPAPVPPPAPRSPSGTMSGQTPRHLLLAGGVDGRYVGGSDIAWLGPTVSAGVLLGRWLPSVSLRQQSSLSDGPSADELSIALAVHARFDLAPLELRAGLVLRGATVQRDLPHRRGGQNRLEGRVGASAALVIPVLRWANVVLSADADAVGLSRESAEPDATEGDEKPRSFPTYTLGGSACLEVPL